MAEEPEEMLVKLGIAAARRVVVLADSSKFDVDYLRAFATTDLAVTAWSVGALVFAVTGLLGFGLGPILNAYLTGFSNGGQIVMMALGMTGATFVGLSAYALKSRKDFSFMRQALFAGILIAFLSNTAFSYYEAWRWMLGIIAIPGVLFLIGVFALPDSPRWLIMAGRGFGKTRTGAEWVRALAEGGRARRVALVAETAADLVTAVTICTVNEGAGIIRAAAAAEMPVVTPSAASMLTVKLVWNCAVLACTIGASPSWPARSPTKPPSSCANRARRGSSRTWPPSTATARSPLRRRGGWCGHSVR